MIRLVVAPIHLLRHQRPVRAAHILHEQHHVNVFPHGPEPLFHPRPEKIAQCIQKAHIGFMFAPKFHPAMKYVQPVRKELGFRTVFNILGPLANPAGTACQVMGVPDETLMQKIAETLKLLGTRNAIVVHSEGLDEISTMGPTKILELKNGKITPSQITPADFDIPLTDFETLKGGDAAANAEIIRDILSGKETGPKKDIVVLNAAAAIITGGLTDNFKDALTLADNAVKQGKALESLEKLIQISNEN